MDLVLQKENVLSLLGHAVAFLADVLQSNMGQRLYGCYIH